MTENAYIEKTDAFMASLGVETYRVGGSVRDELLGVRPKDADYMVRGVTLLELSRLLWAALGEGGWPRGDVRPLKLRDGTQGGWRVSARGLGVIEIMLPRKDVPRDPKPGENLHQAFDLVVDGTLPLFEDAKRRDFTFNALYKNVASGVIADPTARGLYDLERRFIATTHPDSFRDDPLRILRALRFEARKYELTRDTFRQMHVHAEEVTGLTAAGVSGTVLDELCKILMGDYAARALRTARDTRVLEHVLPELEPMLGFEQGSRYHDLTTDEHTFEAIDYAAKVDAPLRVRMALLFHDAGKPDSAWTDPEGRKHYYSNSGTTLDHEAVGEAIWREVAERLNAPKTLREDVATLIREHMLAVTGKFKPSKLRRMRARLGDDMLHDLIMHRACDAAGKGKPDRAVFERLALMESARIAAQRDKVPASVKELEINGNDVMAAGAEGRRVGYVLQTILDEVVTQPDERRMSRAWQMDRVRTLVRV